ncbi:MAG: hypothetical protein LBD27_02925 [Tannerella sp.]|nr:hypothetical protein [Tannerella sp.]
MRKRSYLCLSLLCLVGTVAVSGQINREDATKVIPVKWKSIKAHKPGKDEAQCRRLLSNAIRYNMAWIEQSLPKDSLRGMYVLKKYDEQGVRPSASVCFAAAVALKCTKMNEREMGISRREAFARTIALVKGVAAAYKANRDDGKGWGDVWQSAHWAALAGQGAWLLWEELDSETQRQAQTMVTAEAARFIRPDYRVPYWTASDGHVNTPGDTKAEENAWNAGILLLAMAMMPEHPQFDAWKRVANELLLSSYALESDLRNDQTVDGKPVKDWLKGYNVRDDGAVVNHNLVHPDYTTAVTLKTRSYVIQPFAAQPVLAASDLNLPFIYRSMVEQVWTSPPYEPPGSAMYIPGKAEVYYPQGTDWSKFRFDIYYLMDVGAHVFGWDDGLKHKAVDWMRIRADKIEAMQARHSNGSLFAKGEFETYPGCEQMTAWVLADAWLFFRLHTGKR